MRWVHDFPGTLLVHLQKKLNHFISADSSWKLLAVLPPPPCYNVANPVIFWIQARSVQRCLWGEGRGGACVKPHKRKFVPVIVHLVIHRWAPAPERPICANPGLKFCSFFIYLPIHCLESHILFWHFCILEQQQYFTVLAQQYFLSSSCMFLGKKTLFKIWLNPGLNLAIFPGTRPRSIGSLSNYDEDHNDDLKKQ